MKRVFKRIIAAACILLLFLKVQAQSPSSEKAKTILTADSLATGNLKDVLTSFFQLSFDKLTGQRKELNFQSNPYAVLLRANPGAAEDVNYRKYRVLRKFNFGFGLALDSNYRFNGFSSGIRYALINKRDSTVSKWLFEKLRTDTFRREIGKLSSAMRNVIETKFSGESNEERRDLLLDSLNILTLDNSIPFNKFSPFFRDMVIKVADSLGLKKVSDFVTRKPQVSILAQPDSVVNALKQELRKAVLWTVSLSDTTYKDQFFFSNILLKTELLKGIGKYKPGGNNVELNLQAGVNFVDDSTHKAHDLSRSLFRFEPGVNWVFRNETNDQSFFELKFSSSYIHNFGSLYIKERRDSLTFNATLRVRIIGDIWIPLEIKYDPRKGNVFGFLNVRFNFNGQGKKPTAQS